MHPNSLANLIPARPGDVRNPKGRINGGAYIIELCNGMIQRGLRANELRKIQRDESLPIGERAAANRLLCLMERPDLADYDSILDGTESLRELRHSGVDTSLIKKAKSKRRSIPQLSGDPVVEVEREIELHDRSGIEFDRILDRLNGQSTKTVSLTTEGPPIVVVFGMPPGMPEADDLFPPPDLTEARAALNADSESTTEPTQEQPAPQTGSNRADSASEGE